MKLKIENKTKREEKQQIKRINCNFIFNFELLLL